MNSKRVHVIGNAHIDPVWLWQKPDDLAEIKATFRLAFNRIKKFPSFILTSSTQVQPISNGLREMAATFCGYLKPHHRDSGSLT